MKMEMLVDYMTFSLDNLIMRLRNFMSKTVIRPAEERYAKLQMLVLYMTFSLDHLITRFGISMS